jgi:ferredoxin-NADP reductase/ferredoxin
MHVTDEVATADLDSLPFQLFLWIAGSDGVIGAREIQVFLRMLENCGWCQSRWARENLHRTHERYAGLWNPQALSGMSRDLEALETGLRDLRRVVALADASLIKADLVRLAEAVARASGGILGHAAIRREERAALLVFSALSDDLLLASDERVRRPRAPVSVPAVGARESSVWTKGRLQVRCVQIVDETANVKTFRLAAASSTRFLYLPGQFITLEIIADGERLVRSYTIASSPSRPHVLEVTVKRVPGGRASNWLHDHLRIGDELTIAGPAGRFSCELVSTAEKLLFISGGSGITPVMSMSRYLNDAADPRDVVFFHSAHSERDLAFRSELELLAARNPRFRPVFTLTDSSTPPGWTGLRGRISLPLLDEAVPDFRDRTVFLCGPTPFMEAVRLALRTGDFPMESFHAESFGGPRQGQSMSTRAPVALEAARAQTAEHPHGHPADRRSPSARLLGVLPRPRLVRSALPLASAPSEPSTPVPITLSPALARTIRSAVVFCTSGQEALDCTKETILEAAEALGLSIPSACRAGVCGTCKTRKLSGDVSMDCEDGLDAADRSAGFILACTARPVGRVSVEA